ncbi:MAG TPA: cytochrome c biogenesis protein ResB [Candidatus Paceibacterota bacterium]|nr:cytochrome c biogenesis protein ResB [Candidatus Paceibacterota bacterium]
MLFKRLIKIFTSLRLTVILLAFAIVLVFVGTLAQVDEGLYQAQARYFRQWIIFGMDLFGYKIPIVFPGGYLIGTMLLVNLVCAHIYRFQFSVRKIGIMLAHAGVILLLVGQLVTDMFAHESQISFAEGQTKSVAESPRSYELTFTSDAGPNEEQIVAIPGKLLARGGDIQNQNLPFTIRVKNYWKNSEAQFRAPMMQNTPPLATNGVALNFDFHPAPDVKTMDDRNVPTAEIELTGPNGSLGDWVVSDWMSDGEMVGALQQSYAQQLGAQMTQKIIADLTQPQSVFAGGKQYTFALQPQLVHFPFSLKLLKATHTVYEGTDIPKDFRSLVQLQNPKTGESRQVEISMNHPLRYDGLTFYQYQMTAGEAVQRAGVTPSSVLQVVRNPSWLTPYIGCAMVAAGLVTQFMFHLVGFVSKRKKK